MEGRVSVDGEQENRGIRRLISYCVRIASATCFQTLLLCSSVGIVSSDAEVRMQHPLCQRSNFSPYECSFEDLQCLAICPYGFHILVAPLS